jgi:hypothetical protein
VRASDEEVWRSTFAGSRSYDGAVAAELLNILSILRTWGVSLLQLELTMGLI